MTFEEITPKTKIIVSVTNGGDMQARFMTKVMQNNGEFLLVIPFRHKGSRINFNGKQVKIHMEVRDKEGLLWSFKNCKIVATKKDGLVYHKLFSPMKNGIENRRGGRRFYLWEQCIINIEGVTNPLFTNIRDVGSNGISFVVDNKKNLEIREGTKITCSFKNKDGDEFALVGMVVRKEKLEKYTIYGVKLDDPPLEFVEYVQRLERRNTIVDAEI